MSADYQFASVGDILSVDMIGYVHRGVYLGDGQIFTSSPEKNEHICTIAEFSNGRPLCVTVVPFALKQFVQLNVAGIINRPTEYNLLINNCEHAVSKAYGLKPTSCQVNFWLLSTVLVVSIILCVRRFK